MLKFHWLISIKGNQANDAVEHLLIVEILNNKTTKIYMQFCTWQCKYSVLLYTFIQRHNV